LGPLYAHSDYPSRQGKPDVKGTARPGNPNVDSTPLAVPITALSRCRYARPRIDHLHFWLTRLGPGAMDFTSPTHNRVTLQHRVTHRRTFDLPGTVG
jgi:hypothetical protein